MMEYEPEEVSRKILCVLSLIVALATSYPSYSAITTGTTQLSVLWIKECLNFKRRGGGVSETKNWYFIQNKIQSALKPFKFLYFKWFTGLEASRTINPHLIITCLIGIICIISASGQFFYGKYYLNKFHKTRETIERNNLPI